MKGWLIYSEGALKRNEWYINKFINEAAAAGFELRLVTVESLSVSDGDILCEGRAVPLPDCAVLRAIAPDIAAALEAKGVRCFNSALVNEICNDKGKTYLYLKKFGVPMPETLPVKKGEAPADPPFLPCVIKAVAGHGGSEVFLAETEEEYAAAREKLGYSDLVIQRVVSRRGRDLRVYVLGDRILAGVMRSSDTDFRSNFSLGGRAELYPVEGEVLKLVRLVMEALRPDQAGIDVLFDNGRPVLGEVEDIAGTRMLYSASDIDAVKLYAGYIADKIKS